MSAIFGGNASNRETKTQMMLDFEFTDQIKTSKVINSGNTVKIVLKDGTEIIRVHHTNIVTKKTNGHYVLNSGNWKTMFTKTRLNEHSPANIYQDKSMWYVSNGSWKNGNADNGKERSNFYDGITVDEKGEIVTEIKTIDVKKIEKLKRRIKKFTKKILTMKSLLPNDGDCFLCRCDTESKDHLWSHIVEGYMHGSLIVKAFKHAGYTDQSIGFYLHSESLRDRTQQIVYKFLRDKIIVHKVERN